MEQITDEQLLQLHQAGDERAFAQLVKRYEMPLYNFLLRFLSTPALAEDVFQDTFLQVHLSSHTFETDRKFRPWLYTIAANKARDRLRKIKKQPTVSISSLEKDDFTGELWDLLMQDDMTAEQAFDQKQTAERVREVIGQLPDHLREILLLAYFEQLAYKEIAEILDIPIGTVKSRLHSAVAAFAKKYFSKDREPTGTTPRSDSEQVD